MASCTHHCTTCGAHFTSLRAFDAHRHGPWDDRRCEIPDELVERAGTCKLTGEVPIVGVPVFGASGCTGSQGRLRGVRGRSEGLRGVA